MTVGIEVQDLIGQEHQADPQNAVSNTGKGRLFESVQSIHANAALLVQNPTKFLEQLAAELSQSFRPEEKYLSWLAQDAGNNIKNTSENISVSAVELTARALDNLCKEAQNSGITLDTIQRMEAACGILRIAQGAQANILDTTFFPPPSGNDEMLGASPRSISKDIPSGNGGIYHGSPTVEGLPHTSSAQLANPNKINQKKTIAVNPLIAEGDQGKEVQPAYPVVTSAKPFQSFKIQTRRDGAIPLNASVLTVAAATQGLGIETPTSEGSKERVQSDYTNWREFLDRPGTNLALSE